METPQSAESSKQRSSVTETPPPRNAVVAVIDTETTGLGPLDEPISLGLVLFEVDVPKGGCVREIDAYYGLREPSVPISTSALAIHGLGASKVAGQQFDMERVRRLIEQADYVVAHNAEFDGRMLAPILPAVARKSWRCSYRQVWWSDHIPVPNRKLDTICEHLGIQRPNPHNALDDCRALAAALFTRTGKTNRSRTFLGVALAKGDFPIVARLPQPTPPARAEWRVAEPQTPKKGKTPEEMLRAILAALLIAVGLFMSIFLRK